MAAVDPKIAHVVRTDLAALHPGGPGDRLTEQQGELLRMLATGMKDERIARALGV
ncbi:hypothetical protein [Streptomyces sp. SJL17-1]|uniref:hypothetical protein n=1 Tax=Streptomyces sp. SJL17-1 TaxID=2967223 RepID=UPI00296686F7|nr:hypothetical protein [Streptomyces sp. SJL17-1]